MRTVPVHNLRRNEKTWTPAAVACLDTETFWHADGGGEVHQLRCWAATLTVRRPARGTSLRTVDAQGTAARGLAAILDDWSVTCPALWVYAHNLAFDLTVAELDRHLRDADWEITDFAVDTSSPFVRLARGKTNLTLVDSFSWLPSRLDDVAAALGMTKPVLPAGDDDLDTWYARCRADVDILAAAMGTLLDWWEKHQLGRWSVTGTASGWNVMRHLATPKRITVHPDPAGITADRTAIYGGRRGVWRTGRLPRGRYAELDFTSAYPQIAANLPLPCQRMARFDSLPAGDWRLTSERHGVIARCRIRTDTPRWPVRHGRRVWYPVGEFWTDLAGPDIAEALRLGCLLEVGPGWTHQLGYALAPWARWILTTAAAAGGDAPPVAGVTLKHWGRAVIGKWAQKSYTTIRIGPAPTHGWWATEGWNHTQNTRAVIMDLGGWRWQAAPDHDADDCYPAILAWVEAYVRVRLGRLIDSLPAGAAVAADTDGVIVAGRVLRGWEPPEAELAPLTARVKQTWRDVEVLGPQHLVLDGQRRFAGVPASAVDQGDGTLRALLWPKLAWQMAHGRPSEYTRPAPWCPWR